MFSSSTEIVIHSRRKIIDTYYLLKHYMSSSGNDFPFQWKLTICDKLFYWFSEVFVLRKANVLILITFIEGILLNEIPNSQNFVTKSSNFYFYPVFLSCRDHNVILNFLKIKYHVSTISSQKIFTSKIWHYSEKKNSCYTAFWNH